MPGVVKGPEEYLKEADTDGSGGISLEELEKLLKSVLPRPFTMDETKFRAFAEHEFYSCDVDQDGLLNKDEFFLYYYSRLCFDLGPNIQLPDGTSTNPGERLFRIYTGYCSYGHGHFSDEMTRACYTKLCKDAKIVATKAVSMKLNSKVLSKQALDLIFTKVQANRVNSRDLGGNKIVFTQFLEALTRMGQRKNVGVSTLIQKIIDSGMPKAPDGLGFLSGLDSEDVPLSPLSCGGDMEAFDDLRASFANALPGRSWISGYVSDFIEWTPTASNGNLVRDELRKSGLWRSQDIGGGSPLSATFKPFTPPKSSNRIETVEWWTAHNMSWDETLPELKEIFMAYNQNQVPPTLHDMDCNSWVNLLTDARLIGANDQGGLKAGAARELFFKIQRGRPKKQAGMPGQKSQALPASKHWMKNDKAVQNRSMKSTITINQFVECLRLVASERRMALNTVCEKILIAGAPSGHLMSSIGIDEYERMKQPPLDRTQFQRTDSSGSMPGSPSPFMNSRPTSAQGMNSRPGSPLGSPVRSATPKAAAARSRTPSNLGEGPPSAKGRSPANSRPSSAQQKSPEPDQNSHPASSVKPAGYESSAPVSSRPQTPTNDAAEAKESPVNSEPATPTKPSSIHDWTPPPRISVGGTSASSAASTPKPSEAAAAAESPVASPVASKGASIQEWKPPMRRTTSIPASPTAAPGSAQGDSVSSPVASVSVAGLPDASSRYDGSAADDSLDLSAGLSGISDDK